MTTGVRSVLVALALTAGLLTGPVSVPAEAASTTYVKKKVTVGTTGKGRKIVAYFRGDPQAKRVLLVLGQMHGDEKAGRRTARHIVQEMRPKQGTGVWIVPTMNPDGNARGTRTNGRGVDLNRNWPTSGWIKGAKGSRTYGGPRKGSERETKAMMAFLRETKPDYIVSLHQPLNGIGKSGKDVAFEKRLATQLGLKRKYFGVAQGSGVSPTLTGWYNDVLGRHGTAITVEYGAHPSRAYSTWKSAHGIFRAAKVHR